MKNLRLYLGLIFVSLCMSLSAQNDRPDWVSNRPPSMLDYIGIGTAPKSNPDYREVAKRLAMEELLSEIEVTVSSNSLMTISETDDSELSSYFKETVKTSASKRVLNMQIHETWEDEESYWVFYRLDKDDYAEQLQKMIDLASKQGAEMWQNGELALQSGDLMTAMDYFIKGLNIIEPFANEDLRYEYDGKSYSLGNMLFTSFRTLFDGIELTAEPSAVEIVSFNGNPIDVTLRLMREGQPLRNMHIKGEFVNGSGIISPITPTDASGISHFNIQNITSKNPNQSVVLKLDTRYFIKNNDEAYNQMLSHLNKNLPTCIISLVSAENSTLSAFIESDDDDNASLVRSLKSFINNKYFDITDTPNTADLIIKVDAQYKKGGIVNGDVYRMVEYFTTINISFIENCTGRELSNYTLDSKRTLVPESVSETAARNLALRDAMKSVKRQLPDYLKNLKIKANGKIPQRDCPKGKDPVIVIKEEPEPDPNPEPSPQPDENKYIEDELEEGIFIRYIGKKDFSGRTILKFHVINRRNDDYNLVVYDYATKVIDSNGSELKIKNIRLGSKYSSVSVSQTIVPGVPTRLEIEVPSVEAVALFSISVRRNGTDNVAKLRNLNYQP